MSEETAKQYYLLLSQIWKLIKNHNNPQTDEEWDALVEEARAIPEAFAEVDEEYARKLATATLSAVMRYQKREGAA